MFRICNICEPTDVTALVKRGFWPLSPKNPTTGVSMGLLRWYRALLLEGHLPLKAFTAAVVAKEEDILDLVVRTQSQNFGHNLFYLKLKYFCCWGQLPSDFSQCCDFFSMPCRGSNLFHSENVCSVHMRL